MMLPLSFSVFPLNSTTSESGRRIRWAHRGYDADHSCDMQVDGWSRLAESKEARIGLYLFFDISLRRYLDYTDVEELPRYSERPGPLCEGVGVFYGRQEGHPGLRTGG